MSDSGKYIVKWARKNVVIFVVVLTVISYLMIFDARQNVISAHGHFVYSAVSDNDTYNNLTEVDKYQQGWLETNCIEEEDEDKIVLKNLTDEMKQVVNVQRKELFNEMAGYKYFDRTKANPLNDLIPEEGGKPVRSIVITTWRSGSTFIGGILNSHPATYHFSEPLTDFRTVQIRDEPYATPAIKALKNLLTCNYKILQHYLKRSKEYTWLFTHNTRVWKHCKDHQKICWEPEFLTAMCHLFPFQSMKVVHLRLRLVKHLLEDPDLNVRVLYLVRDPRGTMSSRFQAKWCMKSSDCGSHVGLCADLIDDYAAALRLNRDFPLRFKMVRYEDLSLKPFTVVPQLMKFLGLNFHSKVKTFLQEHTTKNNTNFYSTYRDSSVTALLWRRKLQYGKTKEIQKVCSVALDAWGYLPVNNASHQLAMNPLIQPFRLPLT